MSDKIYNHLTGRFIQRYGSAHKKLLKQGLTNENNSDMNGKVKTGVRPIPTARSTKKVSKKYYLSDNEQDEEEEQPSEPVAKKVVKKLARKAEESEEAEEAGLTSRQVFNKHKSKLSQSRIQQILNRLTKKQIRQMSDGELTEYIQKKYVEEETESENESE